MNKRENAMMAQLINAGATSALGTLWTVEDHDSYEFMMRFYRNLFRTPQSISHALQETQIEMSHGGSSKLWAAFVLYR